MSPFTAVSNFLRAQSPYAFCVPCIAKRLMLSRRDVRDALQAIVLQAGFRLRLRLCDGCRQTVEVVEAAPA
jgi:hypothetical protein